MRKIVLLLLLTVPTRTPAADRGLEVAVRGGYALVKELERFGIAENFDALVPVALEIGYRFTPQLYAGLYGEYGFGLTSCPLVDRDDCSGHAVGFGIDLRLILSSDSRLRPWIGVTMGYQHLRLFATEEEFGRFATSNSEYRFGISSGADLYVGPILSVGPYAAAKVAAVFPGSTTQRGITYSQLGDSYLLAELGLRISFRP